MSLPALPAAPGVSVIVSTLNRAGSLANTLLGLRQLRYSDFEIIVVHGPGEDETPALLERHSDAIRVATCPIANLSVSRNIGVGLARKDLVAFLDDDAAPEPDWLDRLAAGFSGPNVAAVGGFIRDHGGVAFQHRVIIANRLGDARSEAPPAAPSAQGEFLSPTGTNVCVRRDCLSAIGGFDERFSYFLEETDVNLRLVERGWSIVFVPDAEVHHYFLQNQVRNATRVPRSLLQLARSKSYFCWKHGPPQHTTAEISARLARYRAQLRRNLIWFQATGRLGGADARRLRRELDEGIADGARLAAQPPGAPALVAGAATAEGSEASPSLGTIGRGRVCWVSASDNFARSEGDDHLAIELVELGHEVTVITPTTGTQTTVSFDGAWRHRVGLGAPSRSAFWRRYGAATLREIERVEPRRRFEFVFCPTELHEALEPLSSSFGIRIVAPSAADARELDASIRKAHALTP